MFKLTTGRGLLVVAALSAVLCSGCGSNTEEQSTGATAPVPKVTGPAAASLPPEMVAAVAAKKGDTPVAVHFALKNAPSAGQPIDVDIALVARAPIDALSATFESTDGLVVVSGASLAEQQNVQPEKPVTHRLTLMPSGDGVFIVTAIAQVQTPDGNVASTFSFPVIVGGADKPAAAGGAAPAAPQAGKPANP